MKKQVSIILIFDFPVLLMPFSLFDIGKGKPYIDDKLTESTFAYQYKNNTKNLLNQIIEATQNGHKVSAYFSRTYLRMMKRADHLMIDKIKSCLDSGNLELIGGTVNHSLSSLHSISQFEREIDTHKELYKSLFDYVPVTFYNSSNIYNNKIALSVLKKGYKNMFAGAVKWHIEEHPTRRIFQDQSRKGLNLFLIDHSTEYRNLDDQFFQLEESMVVLGLTKLLENVKKHKNLVLPSERNPDTKNLPVMDVSQPILCNLRNYTLKFFNGNAMQETSLKQYYDLESEIIKPKNEPYLLDWFILGNAGLYLAMSRTFNHGKEQKAYEAHASMSNMLIDLKLKVEA